MVVTSPNVSDPFADEAKQLAPLRRRGAEFESERRSVRVESGRGCIARLFDAQHPVHLRVEGEKNVAIQLQDFCPGRQVLGSELDQAVVAVALDCCLEVNHAEREWFPVHFETQASQGVQSERLLAEPQVRAPDGTGTRGVEAKDVLQVAQGDVPFAGEALALNCKRQKGLARCVGVKLDGPGGQEKRGVEADQKQEWLRSKAKLQARSSLRCFTAG